MTTSIWYCYAVARPPVDDADHARLAGLTGIHGATVHLVQHRDLVAVVSPVPADEFGEDALPGMLEDLAWLEDVARAHNAVVDWVAKRSTTLPFRLGTIYLDEQRIRDALEAEGHRLETALERVHGKLEWGVKVYTKTAEVAQPAVAPSETPAGAENTSPGRSYLRRRKAAREARESGWRQTAEEAAEVDHALSELAGSRRKHRAQSQELSGAAGPNVLNVAYLVSSDDTEAFLGRVRQVRETAASCTIELTGPWAPYSFAVDDLVSTTDVDAEAR